MLNKYDKSTLVIIPSAFQFKGTDIDEPIVCSQFGCAVHLTPEQQLYGTKCIHHQKQKKIDPTNFISHPIKQSA